MVQLEKSINMANTEDTSNNPNVKEDKALDSPLSIYTEEDKDYLTYLQQRLESAKNQRNGMFNEFNDMTYVEYFDSNEKIANTFIEEPDDDDDVSVSAGTVESKMDAILSNINSLNLKNDLFVFDKDNNEIQDLKIALEDIIDYTENTEPGADNAGDQEKRKNRQLELLKQGTVFVSEEWKTTWKTKKTFDMDSYNGEFKMAEDAWSESLKKRYEGPSRELLYGPSVYLGDITEYYMEDQPFWFTVKHVSYEKAKSIYGKFENFTYVRKGNFDGSSDSDNTIYKNNWQLTDVKDSQVEILIYQDQSNDEFQVLINGVPMFPIGFPLSAITPQGEYNVAKQVLRVNNAHFAYGQSFVSSGSVKQISKIIDEMLRLFVLKDRKSFAAPRGNLSGRNLDGKVLLPGRFTMGISPNDIPKLDEEGGVITQGEVAVLQRLEGMINTSTVSPTFSGQSPQGTQTATEAVELQRQSRMTLGLIILACSLLEKKLGYLRLYNIIDNWFESIGKMWFEGEDGEMEETNRFRGVNRQDADIEGEGVGERQISITDELPSSDAVRALEREESEKKGRPVRRHFIKKDAIKRSKFDFYIENNPEERESSPFHKMMFREQLNDVLAMAQLGSKPNVSGLEEQIAQVWGAPRQKLFETGDSQMQEMQQLAEGDSLKTPEQVGQAMGQGKGGSGLNAPGVVAASSSGGLLGG